MKKSKWEEYWQKRAVKAEMLLTELGAIADADGDEHGIASKVREYYQSVAAGEVKNTALPDAAGESQDK
jgi:hypothetical protein